jgi:hypothetical protein
MRSWTRASLRRAEELSISRVIDQERDPRDRDALHELEDFVVSERVGEIRFDGLAVVGDDRPSLLDLDRERDRRRPDDLEERARDEI